MNHASKPAAAPAARYVFGPVPSRRLGRSLGVDLVPLKTCSYDCIYCQLGRTTRKTGQRREWVRLDDVISELRLHPLTHTYSPSR
jgi:wyosine [tRNA(Phe)-imidazoG37] synthetase (radical SAM superfamily)